ncbi:SH3 domain-containing protein [Sporosarcina ureae]|uniref:SH3 domain-containing protein n=1 Tax=Sporosarcina ureae TaxID=1571 RepID=UPI0026E9F6BB|nr:SH3 domain-containing protein [Sporosarcina ureae]
MRKVLFLIMVLVLSFSFSLPTGTEAATKTTAMYVSAKSDIVLRVKPAKNAERVGTIKNHSKVTVFSSSNGWSHVQAGKSKGYVYTSALSKKNPNAATLTTVTKGLTPVSGLTLTYSPSFFDDTKESFVVKKDGEFTFLFNIGDTLYPDYSSYTYIEDKNRLMIGVSDSDVIFVDVLYPLKQGTYAKSAYDDSKVLVESTTKTIKVKAGTFKNVVILRHKDGSREYIAKGIGIIKSTNNKGTIITELVSYKAKK